MLWNEQADRAAQLNRLIQCGAIDTIFDPFPGQFFPPEYFEWFVQLKNIPRHTQNREMFDLWPAAQTTRYQEHRFSPIVQNPISDYWAVELARFPVPSGSIGFCQWIEQVVADSRGSYYPSNVFYWGSPDFVISDVSNLRWYLRLTAFDGYQPARWEIYNTLPIPSHALPGVPYSDLPVIDALWYPAGQKKDLKLVVPGGYQLRLFLISSPTETYQWQVSGKLSGYCQSTFNDSAVTNARVL